MNFLVLAEHQNLKKNKADDKKVFLVWYIIHYYIYIYYIICLFIYLCSSTIQLFILLCGISYINIQFFSKYSSMKKKIMVINSSQRKLMFF